MRREVKMHRRGQSARKHAAKRHAQARKHNRERRGELKTAAELLREIATNDPEGHAAALGRAYLGSDAQPRDAQPRPVIVLDRIEPGVTPPYCCHGRATCIGCDEWVWLGHESVELVKGGGALPLCQPCAVRLVPPGTEPVARIEDHLRADGPHE